MDQIVRLSLDRIQESPSNPRKTYNEAALQALADSVKIDGIAQPILVRPLPATPLFPDRQDGDLFEVVFGHRRLRAARLAELEEVPCMVRALSDAEAGRLQMVENIKREDMNAVEEADGYAALMRDHGYTVEQLMELSGKGRSHIYGRLTLSRLCPEARRLVVDGVIGAEAALEVAKIPSENLQRKFLHKLGANHVDLAEGGQHTFARARSLRLQHFALALKDAIFPTWDDLLLPHTMACNICPKRSGGTPEVYSDVIERTGHYVEIKGPDVCMDPDCFAAKKAAHLKREAAKLQEGSKTEPVITGSKAAAAIGADGKVKGAYIALKDAKDLVEAGRAAARRDAKVAPPQIVQIQDPRTGKVVRAVERASLKAAGVKLKEPEPKRDWEAEQRDCDRKYQAERDAAAATMPLRSLLFQRVRIAARENPLHALHLQLVAKLLLQGMDWPNARWLAADMGAKDPQDLVKRVGSMPMSDLEDLLIAIVLADDIVADTNNYKQLPADLLAVAKNHGVDVDAIKAEVQASGQAASTPGPAARAPKGAKAAPKGKKPKSAPAKAAAGVKYRDPATGSTWTGRGLQPAWLKAALAGGRTLAEFDTSKVQDQTDDAGSAGGSDAKAGAAVEEGVAA